jgi:hypothetical protein
MNNWWIAALELAGIWTHEQAEHVANNVKNSIHKEKYDEAKKELEAIIADGKFSDMPLVKQIEADVKEVKHTIAQKIKA